MARQGPRGGGKFTASIRLRVGGHGLTSNTLDAMDKEVEFDRAGASFRRRRKRPLTGQNLPSFMPTSATSVVESSAISSRVLCAPTLPAAPFQQACECRGLVSSRTYSLESSGTFPRTISRPSSRTITRMSSRASSRTPPGASFVQQQIASSRTRAGLKTAIRHIHA